MKKLKLSRNKSIVKIILPYRVLLQQILKNLSDILRNRHNLMHILLITFTIFWLLLAFKYDEPIKFAVGTSLLIVLFVIYNYKKIWTLYFIIFTIPLPIYIRFMGRDAVTLTTILIFSLFIVELLQKNIRFTLHGKAVPIFLFMFFLANTISLFNLSGEELLINLRPYFAFLSSVMLFLLIVNMVNSIQHFNKIVIVVCISLFIQVVFSFLILLNFDLKVLSIFTTRTYEFETGVTRPGGIIASYELLAEWFALAIPFAIWLFYYGKNKLFGLFSIIFLSIGIVLTATRGAVVSLFIGLLFLFIFLPNKLFIQKLKYFFLILFVIITALLVIRNFVPASYEKLTGRFAASYETYQRGGSFLEIINRQRFYDYFEYNFLRLFGTGKRYPPTGSFHSLYFTLIYQTGLVGIISFLGFVVSIFLKLLGSYSKNDEFFNKKLLVLLSMSVLVIFLVDEFKIEYLRASYFSQYAWLILAMMLSSATLLDLKDMKTIY